MLSYREKICCGTIFRGPFGEVVIDARFITPCAACCVVRPATVERPLTSKRIVLDDVDDDEEESRLVMDVDAAALTSSGASDADEGFFDRPGTSPGACSGASSPLHLEAADMGLHIAV